jgi:hypothetical protein
MKRSNLAFIALLMGIASFINLLGLEKGLIAIVAGVLAIRELRKAPELSGKSMAWAGAILGALSIVTIVFFMILKGPQLLEYLKSLPKFP